MKRFYKRVQVAPGDGGHQILLDERPVRTPAGAPLAVPISQLAEAIAAEWAAQGEAIAPGTMPLTKLASTAIDVVARRRSEIEADLLRFAETDLLCYRADQPSELTERQAGSWQPLLDWAQRRFDAALQVTAGVLPQAQPPEALRALQTAVGAYDDLRLCALHVSTTATGSLVIGLAMLEGETDAAGAWTASQIDESFQIERWGADPEAEDRRKALRAELDTAALFLSLLAA